MTSSRDVEDRTTEVHEASYLPFLFSETENMASESGDKDIPIIKKATGRRVFNKKGEVFPATVNVFYVVQQLSYTFFTVIIYRVK